MINSDYTQGKKWFKRFSFTVRSKHIRLFSFTIIFKLYIIYETKWLTAIVTVNLSSIFPLLWCRKWSSTQKNEDIPWRGTSSCRQLFRLSGCGMSSSPWKWVKRAKEGHIIYDLKKKKKKKILLQGGKETAVVPGGGRYEEPPRLFSLRAGISLWEHIKKDNIQ